MLGHEDIGRIGQRGDEAGEHADPVQRRASAPELDDEREPEQGEGDCEPEPATHGLVDVEPGPERDEDRREVVDDEGDPDVEPLDADEVEELDEGEAENAEDGEEARLPAVVRRFPGRQSATARPRISAAPVARTSASRIEESPAESRMIFEMTAFRDQRTTADQTSA